MGTLATLLKKKKKKQPLSSVLHATDLVVMGKAKKHPKYCLLKTTTIGDGLGECSGCPVVRTRSFLCCGPGVQSLVGELRSHKLHGTAKKKKVGIPKNLRIKNK